MHFNLGTPAQVWSSMKRAWQVEPTSERFVDDMQPSPMVVGKIIEAKGCVVKDEFLRTGRRARRSDGQGNLKHKPRKSQRKARMVFHPIHPDYQREFDEILKIGKKCRDALFDMAEEAEQAADEDIIKKKKDGENDGSESSDSDSE